MKTAIINKIKTNRILQYTVVAMTILMVLQSCSKIQELKELVSNGTQTPSAGTVVEKPYIILISADGFRHDYLKEHHAPNLSRHYAEGISTDYMLPSYPTLTQPNHFTLLTGLYPGHSGIVGSNFFQRRKDYSLIPFKPSQTYWFESAETIWQTANNQNMVTGNINWPMGKSILNSFPNNVLQYEGTTGDGEGTDEEEAGNNVSIDEKINTVVSWLTKPVAERPHLITIHFGEADHMGHSYGPNSTEVKNAISTIDTDVEKLSVAVKKLNLPVSFILLSDHGMMKNDSIGIGVQRRIDPSFKFVNLNSLVHLYATDSTKINAEYEKFNSSKGSNYQVYKKSSFPAHLKYSGNYDKFNRTGDIIIVPNPGKSAKARPGAGMHGFDADAVPEMRAIFMAWGPAFKNGYKIAPFKNVEVYGLLATVLGLTPAVNDGKLIINDMLK